MGEGKGLTFKTTHTINQLTAVEKLWLKKQMKSICGVMILADTRCLKKVFFSLGTNQSQTFF